MRGRLIRPQEDAVMFLFVFAVLLAESPKPDKDELKKVAGTWAVTGQEHGGKKTPMKELAALNMEVSGDKMTTREGTDVKDESAIVALDARAKPAEIDLKVLSG